MEQEETGNGLGGSLGCIFTELQLSRRAFVRALCATSMAAMVAPLEAMASTGAYFTSVNHWHQCGVGWFFREGVVGTKHYRHAYSVFYGIQQSIEAMRKYPWLVTCLEFDSHAFEAIQEEDPQFVKDVLNPLVAAGKIDIVGGTYSQPYGQLIGWQSNVRQFVEGRKTARETLHKDIDVFLAEELNFHPQMPQLLKLCGFKYASLQVQNNGSLPVIKKAIIHWRGFDGSSIHAIPSNPWKITLDKQYQSLASYLDPSAEEQESLLMIWAEIWPPGLDWGSSFLPYDEGFRSLRDKGAQSLGLSGYMSHRWNQNTPADTLYFKLDDAGTAFGWPQNKGMLWATIGGWGYEGDALFKENRRLEHQLHAAELLLSVLPDAQRTARMEGLWKKLMMTQNHDCFIVAGFPGEYNHVVTTNLEITKSIVAEIDSEVRNLRQAVLDGMSKATATGERTEIVCQNASCIQARQPVTVELAPGNIAGYVLECGDERVELQRMDPPYANGNVPWVGIVDLPPCGMKAYSLNKSTAQLEKPLSAATSISNQYYSVEWDESRKEFSILDRARNRAVAFRPFTGEITHVLETFWASPNVKPKFRAKNFEEVPFSSKIVSEGPVCHAISVRGNLLTQYTTDEPAAWVTAHVVLYAGLRRVDIFAELHTYPQMGFLILAQLEIGSEGFIASRDFPFGEEESHKKQFSALNYVRLQSPGFAVLLAHGGTQQFFLEQGTGRTLLKNMMGRETMKGFYQWQWSMTTDASFTPAESCRFAEEFRAPAVQQHSGQVPPFQSWLSVNDPALVVFRLSADSEMIRIWLMNYSDAAKKGELSLTTPLNSCHSVDFEGKAIEGQKAVLHEQGNQIGFDLGPWEMVALELIRT